METWADAPSGGGYFGTSIAQGFAQLRVRAPGVKLVTLNLQAGTTAQAQPAPDVLRLGGFSDATYDVIGRFAKGEVVKDAGGVPRDALDAWVNEIKAIDIDNLGGRIKDDESAVEEENKVD